MKKTLFLLTLCSAVSVCSAALFPVVVGGRWGYVKQSGEMAINPQFDRGEVFAQGLAPVKMGRWGYVDSTGKVAINPQFDRAEGFSEGLAAVKLGGGP
ncbi:MAG TPA: WG repeat-containing protein, partial [Verrucomicrobiae bacterium]